MTDFPDDDDGALLEQLAAMGVDLEQTRTIDFIIDAPDESAAKAIQKSLAEKGYLATVEYDEGEPLEDDEGEADEDDDIDGEDEEFGPVWTVYVPVKMKPEHAEITRIQADVDQAAQAHGGRSDGWGTEV